MNRRIDRLLLLLIALTVACSAMVGCEWFPESTFVLATDSRLPKWITLPPGLARPEASLSMSYYSKPWGSSATFTLKDRSGKKREEVSGRLRGLGPNQLKHPPPGFPPGYPSYEVVTVDGLTEIIEHRRPEPIFYVTDDPAVRNELGVEKK